MERLTSVNQNFELQFCSEVPCPFYGEPNGCNNPNYSCPSFCYFTSAAEKLVDYEDAGLIPDEIKQLQAENADLKEQIKAKEIVNMLFDTTTSMLKSDKDTIIHKLNAANKEIAELKASQPVRCKDCIHYVRLNNFDNECGITGGCVSDNDFCSNAERRGIE